MTQWRDPHLEEWDNQSLKQPPSLNTCRVPVLPWGSAERIPIFTGQETKIRQHPSFDWTSLVAQTAQCLPTVQETWVQSLGREDLLEKATHSSISAWKTPWTEDPGKVQSMGSQGVGHDWVTSLPLINLHLELTQGHSREWVVMTCPVEKMTFCVVWGILLGVKGLERQFPLPPPLHWDPTSPTRRGVLMVFRSGRQHPSQWPALASTARPWGGALWSAADRGSVDTRALQQGGRSPTAPRAGKSGSTGPGWGGFLTRLGGDGTIGRAGNPRQAHLPCPTTCPPSSKGTPLLSRLSGSSS